MRTQKPFSLLLLIVVVGVLFWQQHRTPPVTTYSNGAASSSVASTSPASTGPAASGTPASTDTSLPTYLPPEAHETLALIARGGPFPHRQDGVVFGNYEKLLPQQPRGYYHEYTVDTPGAQDRGARRIITGGNPPTIYYYTDDHYHSFRSFEINR